MTTWKSVQLYECPECGAWVKDMDDASNHKCPWKRASEEIDTKLEQLLEIDMLRDELKATPSDTPIPIRR